MHRKHVRGFSSAAQFIDESMLTLSRRQREAMTFSKQSAFESAWDAWWSCREPNWDGECAKPVLQDTYRITYRLIESLPLGFPNPAASSEPDGHLSLEWYKNPRRVLSVSVSPDGSLYWAALIGDEDPRGTCQFLEDVPQTLLYWIGRVCKG